MRVDGKFMIGDDVPEGQGAVTQLMNECFDMAYSLRIEAESGEREDSDAPEGEGVEITMEA